MLLWNGACMVHEIFSLEKLTKLKVKFPDAKILAHPECQEDILSISDYIGSTTALLNFSMKDETNTYIVVTETGILHQMQKSNPLKSFIPAPPNNNCACNNCSYMKLNTLEKIYLCLKYELPEINLNDQIIEAAKKPIERMLSISEQLGL
jgi:quinolinate synthase